MKTDLLVLTIFLFVIHFLIEGIKKLNSNGVYKNSRIYLYLVGAIPVARQLIELGKIGFDSEYIALYLFGGFIRLG